MEVEKKEKKKDHRKIGSPHGAGLGKVSSYHCRKDTELYLDCSHLSPLPNCLRSLGEGKKLATLRPQVKIHCWEKWTEKKIFYLWKRGRKLPWTKAIRDSLLLTEGRLLMTMTHLQDPGTQYLCKIEDEPVKQKALSSTPGWQELSRK